MDKNEMLKSLKSMKSKLMATISMLLVSALVLTNVTYAWFVLSTAPEVSGVATTTGANGALEIALQSSVTEAGVTSRAEIENGIGNSAVAKDQTVQTANTTWGNIVDVSTGYGLEGITLYPARLNINTDDNNKVDRASYLSVPMYGTDGRVSELKDTGKSHYVETDAGGIFETSNNYGVNVLGFVNEMGDTEKETIVSYYPRESVRRTAMGKVTNYRTNLRTRVSSLIEANSAGIFSIIFALTMNLEWTDLHTQTVKNIVSGFSAATSDVETSLRWALLAYCIADTTNYNPDNAEQMAELGVIYENFLNLPLVAEAGTDSIKSIAEANQYTSIVESVEALQNMQGRLAVANEELKDSSTVGNAGMRLISPSHTYVMKGTDPNKTSADAVLFGEGILYDLGRTDAAGNPDPVTEDDMYCVANVDNTITNLFSAMAQIVGDYQAEIVAYIDTSMNVFPENATGLTKCTLHMRATGEVDKAAIDTFDMDEETGNYGTLQGVYNSAKNNRASGDIPVQIERSDVTAYGYSVDLAFRASEAADLVLQQEATTRVNNEYDDPLNYNQNLQGGGSTMTFKIFGNMTEEQVRSLLESVYVLFMATDTGEIYGVARAGDVTVELDDVTANLVMYSVDYSSMNDAGDGVIRLGKTVADNVIMSLTPDTPYYVTAVVFLNGDTVNSADVASRGQMSLVGSINMQFALDGVELTAMNYSDFINPPADDGT